MLPYFVGLLCLLLSLSKMEPSACAHEAIEDKPPQHAKDLEAIQGLWTVVQIEFGGGPVKLKGATFHFEKNALTRTYTYNNGAVVELRCTFSLKENGIFDSEEKDVLKPMEFNYQKGSYVLAGDELKICCFTTGKKDGPRATQFDSKKEFGSELIVLKRAKAK